MEESIMKKLVLLLAVVFGVSFVACTEQKPAEEATEAAQEAVEQVADTAADSFEFFFIDFP